MNAAGLFGLFWWDVIKERQKLAQQSKIIATAWQASVSTAGVYFDMYEVRCAFQQWPSPQCKLEKGALRMHVACTGGK